VWNVREIR